jgi:hypothetical protein
MLKPLKKRSEKNAHSVKNNEKNCSDTLIRHLKKELRKQSDTPDIIAAAIASFFLSDKTLPGVKLPTQAFLTFKLSIIAAKLEYVWKLLSHDYQIIESRRGTGTWFTAIKDSEHRRQIEARISATSDNPGANFYDPTLSGPAAEDKHWQKFKNYWSTSYERYSYTDDSLERFELDGYLRGRFSALLNYTFNEDELTFCGRYRTVLDTLIGRNGHLKGDLVVLRPDILLEADDYETGNHMLQFFGFQGRELTLSQLDGFCTTHNQVIVYYVPAFKFGFEVEEAQTSWQRLIDLQLKYGFNVIVHDRYHLSSINTVIFNSLSPARNTFLYYIAPACLLHFELAEINVLICPAKQLATIKKNNPFLHDYVSIRAAYGLTYLLRNGMLESLERSVKRILSSRVEHAKEILLESGLFVEKHLHQPEGWFFYLELKNQKFPSDIIKRLKDLNQMVVEPIVCWSAPQFKKGIVISISSADSDSSMAQHLRSLISDIKTIINPKVNHLTKTNHYETKKAKVFSS